MLSLTDKSHLGVIWTLDILAIVANFVMIFAITFRTPKPLRSYAVFLLNNALVDLTTASASALGAVRVIDNHEAFTNIFVFLGPCSLVSLRLCRLCQALHVNLVQHSTIILLLSFAYRLYIVSDLFPSRPPPSRGQIGILCLLPLLYIALLIVIYYLEENDAPEEILIRFDLKEYHARHERIELKSQFSGMG